jgi:acyl-CoA synthetase (AMP-forming)/AMP-acid ligase II
MLTHQNLVSNVLQALPFEGNFLKSPKRAERGTLLCPLPFFHIYGLTAGLLVSTYVGSKLIFMAQFDLIKYLEIIQTHKVTRGFVVPPIVLALTKHPVVDRYDLTSLECLVSAAAPLGFDVQVACAKRLKCLVKQAWGMTEISPCGAITPDDMVVAVEKLHGTSGKLVPGSEGKIVCSQTGLDLDPTQEGELMVRGPHIMKGYLNDKEATEKTIRADGWMHTGDIGRFDKDGWLYLTDRMKELIKYKGFQVPPAELEAVIASMPEVKDVIVIPVPDDEAGEVPRAYVVKQDHVSKDFDADDIIEFVHANVSPHKRLRGGVIFTDVIPKSPSGKLLRRVQIEIDRKAHENPHHALK